MKVLVSLSGGMDSTSCLAVALQEGKQAECIGFTYGSKHNVWENKAAERVANYYGVPFELIDLSAAFAGFRSDLLLTGGKILEGHYEAENMKQTVVPARNLIFGAILAGLAVSRQAEEIWLGVHAGDRIVYPDCRPEFVRALAAMIPLATGEDIQIKTPFLHTNKVGILKTGLPFKVPYHLTRTCYTTDEIACGKCGSCSERWEAFQFVGVADPIPYQK